MIAEELRIMMIKKRMTPVAKRACRCSPEAYPISIPMFVVNVLAESRKEEGIFTAFPKIMIMAMVSPMARPIPKIMLATIPDLAAGINTRQMVCQCVAPRASPPALKEEGRALKESSEMLIIVGRIMNPKIMEPERILRPGPPR
jgi:hypothetical protein